MTVHVYSRRRAALSALLLSLSFGLTAAAARHDDTADVACFDPVDSTACLQSALTGPAPVVIIPARGGEPWITRPLRINGSNREIILEPGCVIQAKRDEFHGSQDSLFLIAGATNVTLRGRDQLPHPGRDGFDSDCINLTSIPLLRMWKTDYANASKYKKAEWRMGIWVGEGTAGCGPSAPRDKFPYGPCSPTSGIVISDIRVESSGGDGIYIENASNVSVFRVDSNDHYRQGLSAIDIDGMRIVNSSFRNTNGTSPSCGIDLEPSHHDQRIAGVGISNCLLANNTGCGLSINLGFVIGSNMSVSVNVANVTMTNNTNGVAAGNLVDINGSIAISDILIDQDSCPQPERPAIQLKNKGTDGPSISFNHIQLNRCKYATRSPVRFEVGVNPSGSDVLRSPFGGVDMRDIDIHESSGSAIPFMNVSMLVHPGCWPTNSTHCWQPRYVDMANITGSFYVSSVSARSCDLVHQWKARPPGLDVTCATATSPAPK